MMETIKNNKTAVITAAVILVFLIGGYFLMKHSRDAKGGLQATGTSTAQVIDTKGAEVSGAAAIPKENPKAIASGDAVTIADQAAGETVSVASLSLSQDGWVAVRDTEGRTLGAGWFTAGSHANVEIPLLRATAAGEKYQAMLYFDNGDKLFDLHTETLVQNADGTIVGTTFSTK